jgi:hypothetical protein
MGTRHVLFYGLTPNEDHIADTGEEYGTTFDCVIEHILGTIVPVPPGYKRLREVLKEALLAEAEKYTVRSERTVDNFLDWLRRRSLQDFLHQDDEGQSRRERRLRRRLAKIGLMLHRSRKRNLLNGAYGLYHVSDRATGHIIVNAPPYLSGIEQWMHDRDNPVES